LNKAISPAPNRGVGVNYLLEHLLIKVSGDRFLPSAKSFF
jgi:hypothetical protein